MNTNKKEIAILIIDDEIILAKDLEQSLARNGYTNLRIAVSYDKALKMTKENPPSIILCDINLRSDKDGIDLMREINTDHHIPFVFITAYSDGETLNRAGELMPFAYITKPFTEKQLLSSVQMLIESYPQNDMITNRERIIIKHLASGKSSRAIAELLHVSFHTIETHRKNILKKFNCNNTGELLYLAGKNNWI